MNYEENNTQDLYENSVYQSPVKMTRKEFNKCETVKPLISRIRSSAIFVYILVVFNLVIMFVSSQYSIILDILIMLGLALGFHLAQNRVCAILLLIYGIWNMVYMTITMGQLAGYWILLAGIWAVSATFKYGKAWKAYTLNGELPEAK